MKYNNFIPIILTIALVFVAASCERDPDFVKGQYKYENHQLNYVNGLLIQWSGDDLSNEVKDVVREIVKSMVLVEGGTFEMGDDNTGIPDEMPAHRVTVSSFYLAKVTVTQRQWKALMGENELWTEQYGKGDDYPANFISYQQAQQFVDLLSQYSGLNFRMPTEAEWEYAACGGKRSRGFIYSGWNNADAVAWHRGNANGSMHLSATRASNELGLYDMSGNVWEWCSDWYGSYLNVNATNPPGPATGTKRVVRGGSFTYDAEYCRCKARNCLPETNQSLAVGLRLAISANESK